MSKYSSIEASSFDELCAVDDFDVLVCKTSIEDPLGIQTRLYDPEKYPEVPWQDFFVWLQQDDWNSLLGRSRFARDVSRCSVAGRWQAPSETDNPYALLREIFATTSAGAQLVLSVTPSSLQVRSQCEPDNLVKPLAEQWIGRVEIYHRWQHW